MCNWHDVSCAKQYILEDSLIRCPHADSCVRRWIQRHNGASPARCACHLARCLRIDLQMMHNGRSPARSGCHVASCRRVDLHWHDSTSPDQNVCHSASCRRIDFRLENNEFQAQYLSSKNMPRKVIVFFRVSVPHRLTPKKYP